MSAEAVDVRASQPPRVTVVIPTCGRATLPQAVRSALGQAGVDVAVVVVDDSGTAAVRAVGGPLADPRVRVVVHDRRLGVAGSRNDGIAAATGDWVAFLDDDDVWAPDKLVRQIEAAEAAGADWAYAGVVAVDEDLRCLTVDAAPPVRTVVDDLPVRNGVPATASNIVVRRSTLRQVGPFDGRFRHLADWDLAVRLAAAGPPASVRDPLVGYRIQRSGASSDNADLPGELELFAREHAWRRPGRAVDRAEVWRWMAASSLRAGRRWSAARSYARAARAGDAAAVPRALVAALDPLASRHALVLRRRGDAGLTQRADGWLSALRTPVDRPRLPEAELRQAAAERLSPSPEHGNHLPLRGLRDVLAEVLAAAPATGPSLDLYCGVKPYAPLVRSRPLWGLDVDRHLGRADVLGRNELPFADGAFSLVLCTQALMLADDDVRTVEELHRVLTPGGMAVVTVPGLHRRTAQWERRYSEHRLERLFGGFDELEVHQIDPLGAAWGYATGTLLHRVALRSRLAARRLPLVMRGVNAVGLRLDRVLGPLARRFPHSLILVARRSG